MAYLKAYFTFKKRTLCNEFNFRFNIVFGECSWLELTDSRDLIKVKLKPKT